MKPIIHASTSDAVTEREQIHAALARRICAEGIVLLENDGVLPLNTKKIALYGTGARHTAFGGAGSGENNPRYQVNVEQGLENAGLQIANKDWLDKYDALYAEQYAGYRAELAAGLKKVPRMEQMDYAMEHPFPFPAGEPVASPADADTAIYVLTRQPGEGADRREAQGDYYITDGELALLRSMAEHYRRMILVLNVGAVIDLGFLDELRFSAVVLLMQGGMEAGNALADVLTGKVNPSGRLADTWGRSYSDYPSADTFSERSPEPLQEDYREGIYVGYRWFDKNRIQPRYPFGYGLSYTSFEISHVGTEAEGTKITVTAEVKNTGDAAGREVVQLYLSAPEGRLHRESRSLAAFAKTKLLAPGEAETATLVFDLRDHAGFDNNTHEFLLEKGAYILTMNGKDVSVLELDADAVTERVEAICPMQRKIAFFTPDKENRHVSDLSRVLVKAAEIETVTHNYSTPGMPHSPEMDAVMTRLSEKDMAKLLTGSSYVGPFQHRVFGAGGYTTSALVKKGVAGMPMSDGPQGLNLTQKSFKPRQNFFSVPSFPDALRGSDIFSSLGGVSAENPGRRAVYYQFCTAWPSETLVAQTWDVELARLQGDAIGKEMLEFGVVFWLAPAVNIHRNPLCGRNYEYYAEDPVLTGLMAAAVTEGVQSHPGCFVTLKHYAANNLETHRNKSSSNMDERTLREIYLKAFRIAIEKAHAKAVMCSYNKVNGVYAAMSHDLQTKVLRNEWGFDGVVMTDWFATGHDESIDELGCAAGTDLIMPGIPNIPGKLRKALKAGQISHDDLERSTRRIVRLALYTHRRSL
ncbi:MAG: glycoside hydrolase family 3 C-terminal domain-containing protein [bacterium]|nr:glycoside hydrolase family 3 C-terminal domain-containing protein [bacterium]